MKLICRFLAALNALVWDYVVDKTLSSKTLTIKGCHSDCGNETDHWRLKEQASSASNQKENPSQSHEYCLTSKSAHCLYIRDEVMKICLKQNIFSVQIAF